MRLPSRIRAQADVLTPRPEKSNICSMKRAASRAQVKRKRLFREGAEAFQRIAPSAPYRYPCPICMRGFPEDALNGGRLTLDHAPQRSWPGKSVVVLTCSDCNSQAGSMLESQLLRREVIYDFDAGTMARPVRAHLNVSGMKLNVEVTATGKDVHITTPEGVNDPTLEQALVSELKAGTKEISLHFYRGFRNREALVSLLRAAYLVTFATLGYRYVLARELKVVREQIREPSRDVIRVFSSSMAQAPPTERCLLLVERPDWLHSLGIQIGRHLVFLPWLTSEPDIYESLAKKGSIEEESEISGRPGGWPNRPRFALDYA